MKALKKFGFAVIFLILGAIIGCVWMEFEEESRHVNLKNPSDFFIKKYVFAGCSYEYVDGIHNLGMRKDNGETRLMKLRSEPFSMDWSKRYEFYTYLVNDKEISTESLIHFINYEEKLPIYNIKIIDSGDSKHTIVLTTSFQEKMGILELDELIVYMAVVADSLESEYLEIEANQ